MEKYYTPEIEEFHIGFKYEIRDGGHWHQSIYASSHGLDTRTLTNLVRVKHLDREDIESCDFKQSSLHSNIFLKDCDEWNHRPAECIGINFNEGLDHILIFFVEKGGKIKYGQTIFAGKLKNKSELKRILKQIGV